jgi:hypothetical protein
MGWTGMPCGACGGNGQRYSPVVDADATCLDCGGTGEQYVEDEETNGSGAPLATGQEMCQKRE